MGLSDNEIISEQELHKAIQKGVAAAVGANLDGPFTSVTYPAGFDYNIKEQYYSKDSLAVLDRLVENEDGISGLGQSFSSLYYEMIGNIVYDFSSDALEQMKEEEQAQTAMVGQIIDEYERSTIYDVTKSYPSIRDIMDRIKEVTGKSYMEVDIREYPDLGKLCRNLKEYTRLAVKTAAFENEWCIADDRLNAIKQNITEPNDKNGGLKISSSQYNIGWEELPKSLLDDLKKGSSVQISFSSSNFDGNSSTLRFESSVRTRVPLSWFFNMKAENEQSMNLEQFAQNDSVLDVSITFNGVSILGALPTELSKDNKIGWFAADIIKDTAANSGKDVTGYKLNGDISAEKYFGNNGQLKRLKTFVVSQEPVISLHFSKFDCSGLDQFFTRSTKVNFSMIGGLISSGTLGNEYVFSDYHYDEKMQSIDIELQPPKLGDMKVAYVLGGVVEEY